MAEKANVDRNNLCASEDAFDQFQSDTVYEEEDLITLSDIGLPEDVVPHVSTEDMIEIPYDNEVELSSNLDPQNGFLDVKQDTNYENSNEVELSLILDPQLCFSDKNKAPNNENSQSRSEIAEGTDSLLQSIDQNSSHTNSENTDQIVKPKSKRGRKKRNAVAEEPIIDNKTQRSNVGIEEPNDNETQKNDDCSLHIQQTLPKRRGRKPKNRLYDDFEVTPVRTKRSRTNVRNGENEVVNELREVVEIPLNEYPKRHNRKKRASEHVINEVNETLQDHTTSLPTPDLKLAVSPPKRKPGRPKKKVDEASGPSLPTSDLELPVSPTKRKPGRPKRKVIEVIHTDILESQDNLKPEKTDLNRFHFEPLKDDCDEISLSKLKESLEIPPLSNISDLDVTNNEMNVDTHTIEAKIDEVANEQKVLVENIETTEIPLTGATEYTIDITQNVNENIDSLLVEDTSKRPIRRKATKCFHYDEGSDEDPFANVELSDDEPTSKRGKRYYSDDDYVPEKPKGKHRKHGISDDDDGSDSDIDDILEELSKPGRKSRSPKKKMKVYENKKKLDITTVVPKFDDDTEDDIEECLQSSIIKTGETNTDVIDNYIAQKMQGTNLQIKKVTSTEPMPSIEIPVINPNELKKVIEISTQTNIIHKAAVGVQTSDSQNIPMKKNVSLTTEQAEKACEFLKSVVQTTSELGQLMTQKSEDFITKKINTSHVTDTFKMDYCVKKSFLLFKLAKHNLLQMEEDLAKQYSEFLESNGLGSCLEQEKKIEPKSKTADSDSDCEIVETPVKQKPQPQKPKFNPKTVFLNKELSIKIAKKPTIPEVQQQKAKTPLNLQGRHTVWISDSVMVKKVKPNQSFLAQDSRNKKPPDCYVTEKMVSDFFEKYNREKVQSICAPFISTAWCGFERNYVCSYFIVNSGLNATHIDDEVCSSLVSNGLDEPEYESSEAPELSQPATLLSLCIKTLQKQLQLFNFHIEDSHSRNDDIADVKYEKPTSLFRLCVRQVAHQMSENILQCGKPNSNIIDLKLEHESHSKETDIYVENIDETLTSNNLDDPKALLRQVHQSNFHMDDSHSLIVDIADVKYNYEEPASLFRLCVRQLARKMTEISFYCGNAVSNLKDERHNTITDNNVQNIEPVLRNNLQDPKDVQKQVQLLPFDMEDSPSVNDTTDIKYYENPDSLFRLCVQKVGYKMSENRNLKSKVQTLKDPIPLKVLCFKQITKLNYCNDQNASNIIPMMETLPPFDEQFKTRHLHEDLTGCDVISKGKYLVDKYSPKSLKVICHKKMLHLIYLKHHISNEVCTAKAPLSLENNDVPCTANECDNIYDCASNSVVFIKSNANSIKAIDHIYNPTSLKGLCYNQILNATYYNMQNKLTNAHLNYTHIACNNNVFKETSNNSMPNDLKNMDIKSLFSLCVQTIQNIPVTNNCSVMNAAEEEIKAVDTPKCLNDIETVINDFDTDNQLHITVNSLHKVQPLADICFDVVSRTFSEESPTSLNNQTVEELTINSVNTLSEEAFHNITHADGNAEYIANEATNFYNDDEEEYDDHFNNFEEQNLTEESNWVAQVQMKVQSCVIPAKVVSGDKETFAHEDNTANKDVVQMETRIKIEPEDESDNVGLVDSSIIKTEPIHEDAMTVIPDNVVTKRENVGEVGDPSVVESGFNRDTFENFVLFNKMILARNDYTNTNDEIFSQSASRVRRQYDPDSDHEDHETHSEMSLLIPQTFEPLRIETAKDSLMESSSEEDSVKKTTNKKKPEKRSKIKGKNKQANNKEVTPVKEKVVQLPPQPVVNEVAVLTRRMRERIKQQEKKVAALDSEPDDLGTKKGSEKMKQKLSKPHEDEIQCSNVDSTENLCEENINNKFPGFSAVDQSEISNYQKYVNFVYEKILPKVSNESTSEQKENDTSNNDDSSSTPNSMDVLRDQPVEMVECEPILPVFDEVKVKRTRRNKRTGNKDIVSAKSIQGNVVDPEESAPNVVVPEKAGPAKKVEPIQPTAKQVPKEPPYIDRNGWHCYPVDLYESRLSNCTLCLDKLPESFVDTYFRYQNIATVNEEDKEVDRLTNLQSLKRSSIAKDGKAKPKSKIAPLLEENVQQGRNSGITSPSYADDRAELTPSEDEQQEDEIASPAKGDQSNNTAENNLAKNALMNDADSEEETLLKIKKEQTEPGQSNTGKQNKRKLKSSPKKPETEVSVKHEDFMLTADKMMNKELNLLHAPVILKTDAVEDVAMKTRTRSNRTRLKRESASKDGLKEEDDYSSEEEKQWVSTKEKLLKRMGKKQNTASLDDAKRNKLVSEFIERRGAHDAGDRKRGKGPKRGRISKKRLERVKQLRVLSKELYGENADQSRRTIYTHSLFKGRRNIRKVIDKKSLARSTVVANMGEFERKKRLNQKHSALRELLGCEEGVGVLVINDEVCLEYDFDINQPVVAVHPFFTKVMKTHQYEGVKFMWDACFESLAMVQSGDSGGGCILAHCMGLGKTLQVLALLHTVLTHPGAGMHRVLVCCPLSTVLNWVDEIHKWIGPVTNEIKVFELSKLKKTYERAYQLEDWYNGGGIFIIGYELFRSLSTLDPLLDDVRPTVVNKIRTALLDPGPDIVVCDEGHLLKNDCSVLAMAMSRVQTKRRIVLTGTPMQNNLREYYCMVNFIKPNLLGTYAEYSNRFENPIMNGQHRDSQEEDIKLMKQRTHILHKVLEGCLQRQEASVLYPYLPKKHEYTLFISLTKCQWDLYKHYMENYANQNKHSVLKDFHILQKIWSHPQVLHHFQMRSRDEFGNKIKPEKLEDDLATEDLAASEDVKPAETEVWWLQHLDDGKKLEALNSSNKFMIVFRLLEECIKLGDKILIFSTSLITLDVLEYFLKKINKWSLGQEYYRLDGSVPAEVRQKWCREFNAENNEMTKVFLISTRAGCLGLNMVAANRVVILDTSWNPAHDIQSIFRVYRFGQKKDCHIYRLVALGTMEQRIYERSVSKQAVACRVVDEQQIDRHYNMAELTELYRYDETGAGVAAGVAPGVRDEALLAAARGRTRGPRGAPRLVHAIHEHDSLLRGSSEQQLPEHERHAAWLQFQEEHSNKNPLTALSIHMPVAKPPEEPSTEPAPPQPEPNVKKYKGKRKGSLRCRIPVQKETDAPPETAAPPGPPTPALPADPADAPVDDAIVEKIMGLLIKHNFHTNKEPEEIKQLVTSVRRIVAYGKVPKNSFNSKLTQSIADVLLGNDRIPPLTNVQPIVHDTIPIVPESQPTQPMVPEPPRRGRSRRRGKRSPPPSAPPTPTPEQQPPSAVDPPIPSTSKCVEPAPSAPPPAEPSTSAAPFASKAIIYPPMNKIRLRRKAALVAERHMDGVEPAPPTDATDSEWQIGSDPELPPTRKSSRKPGPKSKTMGKKIETPVEAPVEAPVEDESSILLSDDDEPIVRPAPTKQPAPVEPTKTVPLHPSLLNNKNFIKIVAHTYQEGNPMLDEDAAILAAQYSTLKLLKEYEATGKSIDSGPIYDIAVRVLGIDILIKLDKTKPPIKKASERGAPDLESETAPEPAKQKRVQKTVPPVKKEGRKEVSQASPMPKSKLRARGISDLMPAAKLEPVAKPPPVVVPSKPLVRGRVTTTKFSVIAPSSPSAQPSVVPVGLYQNSVNLTIEPPQSYDSYQSSVDITSEAPESILPEESILPDDDVRLVNDSPFYDRLVSNSDKNMRVLNSQFSQSQNSIAGKNTIMKAITLANGQVVLSDVTDGGFSSVSAATGVSGVHGEPPAPPSGDTICLDSDEEEPPPPPPQPTKRVALKSTAKRQAAPEVVPLAITTNPRFAQMHQSHLQSLKKNKNYVVIPIDQLNRRAETLNVGPAASGSRLAPKLGSEPAGAAPMNRLTALSNSSVPPEIINMVQANMRHSGSPTPTGLYAAPGAPAPPPAHVIQMQQKKPATPPAAYPTYSILPTKNTIPQITKNATPQAASSTATSDQPKKKTVCKPGDILRITRTGQVEILNKDASGALATDSSPSTITSQTTSQAPTNSPAKSTPQAKPTPQAKTTPQTKATRQAKTTSQAQTTLQVKTTPQVQTYTHKKSSLLKPKTTPAEPEITPDKSSRKRIRIKSSSSSDASRPGSPVDPLDILRDVVQIQAIDDDDPAPITPVKVSNTKMVVTCSSKSMPIPPTTKDKIQITPAKRANVSNHSILDSVDLTDLDGPSTSSASPQRIIKKDVVKSASKVPQSTVKAATSKPSKIVGTSKNILICGSGKASLITPSTSKPSTPTITDPKKRPPPPVATNSIKKKKHEPLTLKDFDIDDIDDIIELE